VVKARPWYRRRSTPPGKVLLLSVIGDDAAMTEPEPRDPGVLGGLPRRRSQRRSERRASVPRSSPPRRRLERDAPGPPAAPEGVLGTAAHVAGELAQLGLTVGNQVVRGALSRLPRP
jgi:hypothetical protein